MRVLRVLTAGVVLATCAAAQDREAECGIAMNAVGTDFALRLGPCLRLGTVDRNVRIACCKTSAQFLGAASFEDSAGCLCYESAVAAFGAALEANPVVGFDLQVYIDGMSTCDVPFFGSTRPNNECAEEFPAAGSTPAAAATPVAAGGVPDAPAVGVMPTASPVIPGVPVTAPAATPAAPASVLTALPAAVGLSVPATPPVDASIPITVPAATPAALAPAATVLPAVGLSVPAPVDASVPITVPAATPVAPAPVATPLLDAEAGVPSAGLGVPVAAVADIPIAAAAASATAPAVATVPVAPAVTLPAIPAVTLPAVEDVAALSDPLTVLPEPETAALAADAAPGPAAGTLADEVLNHAGVIDGSGAMVPDPVIGAVVSDPTSAPAPVPAAVETPSSDACTDEAPPGEFTCAEQLELNKCDRPWMEGFCKQTCNRCRGGTPPDDTASSTEAAPPANTPKTPQMLDPAPADSSVPAPASSVDAFGVQVSRDGQGIVVDASKVRGPVTVIGAQTVIGAGTVIDAARVVSSEPLLTVPDVAPALEAAASPAAGGAESGGPSGCVDVQPTGGAPGCAKQKEFSKCSASWLIDGDYCAATCGRC